MLPASRQGVSQTEEKIFEAALAIFSRKGLDGARMHEIAARAEINPALLHYYFGHKDDLYRAVLRYAFLSYTEAVAEVLEGADSFDSLLKGFIDGYVDYGMMNRKVLRLVMAENLSGGKHFAEILPNLESFAPAAQRQLIEAIKTAIREKEIRPVDPEQALLTIISACLHFLLVFPMLDILHPSATDRLQFIEDRKNHIFDLIYHGFAA